jgi:LysM repeat protein
MFLPLTGDATINQKILPVQLTAQVQPKEEPKTIQHIVVEGESLSKIAKQYNTTWQRLWQRNTQLTNQDKLNIGEKLVIPSETDVLADRPLYTLPVTVTKREPIGNSPRQVSVQGNGYDYASCTYWVKQWKPEVGNWGNAKNWGYAAQAEGWTVSDTPIVGAVAWTTRGDYGHVGLVIGVGNGTIILKEGNFDWNGSVRTIEVPVGAYRYIF